MDAAQIAEAIDAATLNRGLRGVDWLATPGNIPVVIDEDLALFDWEGDGDYQIHLLFQSRGRDAIESVKEATAYMFQNHGAELIFALVPDFRRDVKLLARWTGYRFAGLRPTVEGPCELFVLSKEMWKKGQAK